MKMSEYSRAVREQEEISLNNEKTDSNLRRRKEKIQEKLNKARFPPAHKEIQAQPLREQESEAQEEKKEAPKKKQYLPVNQHSKKFWKSKKRCWYCRSKSHLKKDCDQIQCFYCYCFGQVKATCYKRKIEFVYQRLMEMETKIKLVQMNRHKAQMNVEKLIKESK